MEIFGIKMGEIETLIAIFTIILILVAVALMAVAEVITVEQGEALMVAVALMAVAETEEEGL
jgi:hypothetical protein